MNIHDIVVKLQTPGRGSTYQDEQMLEDFIKDEVAKRSLDLTAQLADARGEVAALTKINHKLSDQLNALRYKK